MFSYRHGFHAGNHADVLKHIVLVQLLKHLNAKDKPFMVVDTHAGAGAYSLAPGGYAAKNAEFASGIGVLWRQAGLPEILDEYVTQIRHFNKGGVLTAYPGSPQIALQMTRAQDPLRLFELHPTESGVLREYFHATRRRVQVRAEDGFEGLKALLPPPSRRALVLIDPSYEDKQDYARVVTTLRDALQRFPSGVYAIWYPQVARRDARELPMHLERLIGAATVTPLNWLNVTLDVKAVADDGIGLHGSGVFVVNPPWQLRQQLRLAMPALKRLMAQDACAAFELTGMQR